MKWVIINTDEGPFFSLSADQYESASRNQAELTRWVREANFQIKYYREEPPREQ